MARPSQLNRPLRIWFTLSAARRGLTVPELRDRLSDMPVSTLYRQLDALESEWPGVVKDGDRWRVTPGAVAPLYLADEEILALAVAIEGLPSSLRDALTELARKLDATLSPAKAAHLARLRGAQRAVVPGLATTAPVDGVTDAVQFAIAQEQVLRLEYQSPDGSVSQREVEPRGVLVHLGAAHLVAWCRLRRKVRQFALQRVLAAEVLDETFEPDPGFDLEAYAADAFSVRAEAPMPVVVDLAPDVAYLARERTWHASQRTEALPNGWTRLMFDAFTAGPHYSLVNQARRRGVDFARSRRSPPGPIEANRIRPTSRVPAPRSRRSPPGPIEA
jgi:predicted DNA-binding transcriptional regulator YafY